MVGGDGKANKHKHYEDKLGPQRARTFDLTLLRYAAQITLINQGGMKVRALLVPKLKGRLSTGTHNITPPVRNAWAYTVQCESASARERID